MYFSQILRRPQIETTIRSTLLANILLANMLSTCCLEKFSQNVGQYIIMAEVADSGYYVAPMLQKMFGVKCAVKCFTDNKRIKDHLETSNIVSDLRLRVDMARLKEMVKVGEITITWIEGKRQLAGCLTKHNAPAAYLVEVLASGTLQ